MPYPDQHGHTVQAPGEEAISPAGFAFVSEIDDLAEDVLDDGDDGLPMPEFPVALTYGRRTLQAKIAANIFFYLSILLVLLLSASALLSKTAQGGIGGLRFFIEQTDAMAPIISKGSLLVTVNRKPVEIEKGDIITFEVLEGRNNSRLTRLVDERLDNYNQGGMTFFRTILPQEGAQPDSVVVNQTNVRGVKIAVIPYAGYAVSLMNTYAPALAVLAAAMCCSAVLLRKWSKRVRGKPAKRDYYKITPAV